MLPTTDLEGEILPTSTRMRNTRATRNRKVVSREKMRRVRVADLMVRLEGRLGT